MLQSELSCSYGYDGKETYASKWRMSLFYQVLLQFRMNEENYLLEL